VVSSVVTQMWNELHPEKTMYEDEE
jgi:hypothetical protein